MSEDRSHPVKLEAVESSTAKVGIVLLLAALVAIVLDNSSLSWIYDAFLKLKLSIRIGEFGLDKPLVLWINDGLMAVFFLLVGIEIKRELIEGQFEDKKKAVLPFIAALGGMIVPALFYYARNHADSVALAGWAIPCATDIAFALGILSLAGPSVPTSIRLFLTAVAVIDDLLSIIVIAVFYTAELSTPALAVAGLAIVALFALNRLRVVKLAPYALLGLVLWVAVLKSGVHATLAGVVLAFCIPLRAVNDHGESPAKSLEHALVPWVNWFVLPLFAFANAGLPLLDLKASALLEPVPSGIALGLLLGKPLGICGSIWIASRLGLGSPPDGATFRHLLGMGFLGGIGFTMSLFIGSLAFSDVEQAAAVRLGVLVGSLLAGVVGYRILKSSSARAV